MLSLISGSIQPVTGRFFRLTHTYSGLPQFYFRGKIAQYQHLADRNPEIYGLQTIEAKDKKVRS